ncbi:isopeptide-forming domain-containing protein [Corynebacterium vitaeruminis]|uniref:Surface-anchored protein fimbrial subunit n=1 Tax=Corynebacterium vitaeruminis DSM 20294 TaxID=1224164 RepID=W5YAX3_9CORY|nr:hypothetical protein [Corynebacterium vitaeruminis]AHI23688.1 surface-anchored protein fimbrial subunit [Corynebacterium vitaeruminis DSM 20294]
MISRLTTGYAAKLTAAVALTMAISGGVFGAAPALAAHVVGAGSSAGAEQLTGTNNLKITLVKGTDENGNPSAGSVAGVTITLDRLAGIDPANAEDMKRFEAADIADIQNNWPKDLHFEKVTNSEGTVSFEELPTGVYLVTSVAPSDGGEYREVSPFLVAVPFHTGDYQESPVEGVILAKSKSPITPPDDNPPVVPTTPRTPGGTSETTPTQPPATDTPGTPGGPTNPGNKGGGISSLPLTGVQVIGLVIAAAILIGGGFLMILLSRKRKGQDQLLAPGEK